MSAATAQQAALRILLEDIEPLLQRAEASAASAQAAHEGLQADLATLGTLVQRSTEAPAAIAESAGRLASAAARIEACLSVRPSLAATAVPPQWWRSTRHALPWWLAGALCGAACGAGAVAAIAQGQRDDAHLGQALQRSWTSLDAATRAKVEAALRR
ncbi:hypothetical protein [Variovorax paradoxus]|jgi:hypothetical protein|uniref:Uncharacterized protein n=1 Tax=Variovorax paradoxus TaxID=34073 RepID=A0A679JAB4_VARPD|nr:hypothetical protein VVAX_06017 [Variovorax paradoxus]